MDAEETQELLELIDIRIRPPVGGQACNVVRVDANAYDSHHVTLGISQMTLSINHEECCLPPGWSAKYSPEHQRVCFYHESGRMQWTHPRFGIARNALLMKMVNKCSLESDQSKLADSVNPLALTLDWLKIYYFVPINAWDQLVIDFNVIWWVDRLQLMQAMASATDDVSMDLFVQERALDDGDNNSSQTGSDSMAYINFPTDDDGSSYDGFDISDSSDQSALYQGVTIGAGCLVLLLLLGCLWWMLRRRRARRKANSLRNLMTPST